MCVLSLKHNFSDLIRRTRVYTVRSKRSVRRQDQDPVAHREQLRDIFGNQDRTHALFFQPEQCLVDCVYCGDVVIFPGLDNWQLTGAV